MTDSEHDDEFEAYLKRRVPIDQRMKTVDRLEPPPELDRIIIGKARNAIQNSPQVPLYRAPKWALPVGLAATLLMAFCIVLNLGIRSSRHPPQSVTAVAQVPAGAAHEPLETRNAPVTAPIVSSTSTRQEVATSGSPGSNASASTSTGSNTAASATVFARLRPPPIKTAPWPPLRRAEKPAASADSASSGGAAAAESTAEIDPRSRSAERRVAEKRMRTDDSQRVAAAAPDVSSPGAGRPVPDVATAAPAANAGAPAPLRLAASSPQASAVTFDSVKVTEPRRSAERLDSASNGRPAARNAAPAVLPSTAPAPRAAANPAVAPSSAASDAAPSTVASSAVAAGSAAGASPVAGPAAAASADRREHPDPKVWLDQIQKLRVAGLTAQAEQELKHFRDAYPAYPTGLPDGSTQ
jgi:hypothetical protein